MKPPRGMSWRVRTPQPRRAVLNSWSLSLRGCWTTLLRQWLLHLHLCATKVAFKEGMNHDRKGKEQHTDIQGDEGLFKLCITRWQHCAIWSLGAWDRNAYHLLLKWLWGKVLQQFIQIIIYKCIATDENIALLAFFLAKRSHCKNIATPVDFC